MKILRVVASMNPQQGGVVEAVNQAALSFNNEKWQMDVLCLDDPNAPWIAKNKNYAIHAIGVGKSAYGLHFSYLFWLYKNAKNYEVVIIDGLWQFLVVGGYLLSFLKVPYCVFVHGMLSPYFNQFKLKRLKKMPFWFLIERNVISLANATIFTCAEELYLAKQSMPYYRANSKVSTLGVKENGKSKSELCSYFFHEFSELKDKRYFLFLSRIHPIKGIDLLIDALGQIKNLPDDFILAIAGPDSTGFKAKLVEQIKKLGLDDRVVWLGMLNDDIKWGAYHAAEVFILPSHQENFGIVVAEALSTSTPVLVTNKVNIWREILETEAGFVENDDVEGVEKLLLKWLDLTASEKQDMRGKASSCYQNNFSIESAVSDLEKVLLDVVAAKDLKL